MYRWLVFGLVIFLRTNVSQANDWEYGLLVVEHSDQNSQDELKQEPFCIYYYPSVFAVAENKSVAEKYPVSLLNDLEEVNTCEDGDDLSGLGLEGTFPIFSSNMSLANCSLWEKVVNIQKESVVGVLAEGNYGSNFNTTEFDFTIPFAGLLLKGSKKKLLEMKEKFPDSHFYMHRDEDSFDMSTIVIFCMAVGTVMAGSFWSGYTKQHLRLRKERRRLGDEVCGDHEAAGDRQRVVQQQLEGKEIEEDISVQVSPVLILIFVFCMCAMLVLLFFFFSYLVYVIMLMFCIASTLAMYSCFEPLVMMTYALPLPIVRLPKMNLCICRLDLELRQMLLLLCCVATTVIWFIFRKSDWSWILQDFLGILFSINMLKVLRLPSLKICTCLLVLLFVYDIFFVFITPLIIPGGKSIMVEVAVGHNRDEQLPMVLKVPHFSKDPCYSFTYSLLGFGDILVPGLLLSFCHGFDLMVGTPCKLYWLLSCIFYALGLLATFVSLYLMNSAQPALLYLVPFTLIPIYLVALCRGEFIAIWKGDVQEQLDDETEEEEQQTNDEGDQDQ